MFFFRIGSRQVHLPKLIGALVLIAAVLMVVKSSAVMVDSWDIVKDFPKCVANAASQIDVDNCRSTLKDATGVVLQTNQGKLNSPQFWAAILGPVASLFGWAVVLVLGLIFYRTGEFVIPIEETVKNLPEHKRHKK